MSRPMHRHRKIRLESGRAHNNENRRVNAPRKIAERSRRDTRVKAAIKARTGGDYSPAEVSWICAQLDKEWRQVTKDDIKALVG